MVLASREAKQDTAALMTETTSVSILVVRFLKSFEPIAIVWIMKTFQIEVIKSRKKLTAHRMELCAVQGNEIESKFTQGRFIRIK